MTKPSGTLDTLARLRARSEEAGRFVLALDPVWADKINEAYGTKRRAELIEEDGEKGRRVAEAQAAIDELVGQAGDNVVVFKFRRLSRSQYDELIHRHPPSAAQRKEDEDNGLRYGERRVFNNDTLGPDLLSMTLIDPPMTIEEAKDLINGTADEQLLSKGEAEAMLFAAITAAQSAPKVLPEGLRLP